MLNGFRSPRSEEWAPLADEVLDQTSGWADPNLSESAAALVKEQPGGAGEGAVVAQIQEQQPLLDLSGIDVNDILLFEDINVEDETAGSTQEPGAGVATVTSFEPDVSQMLVMPPDSRGKWVQFNHEAQQVRNQNSKYGAVNIHPRRPRFPII